LPGGDRGESQQQQGKEKPFHTPPPEKALAKILRRQPGIAAGNNAGKASV
jgi:hypothetical protein